VLFYCEQYPFLVEYCIIFTLIERFPMKKIYAILSILTLTLSGCAVDWAAKGFEAEEQYKLADARALSPYGAKLFFGYGLTTIPLYDVAMNEMISSKYADKKELIHELLEKLEKFKKKWHVETKIGRASCRERV
jgi:hypothetical protein